VELRDLLAAMTREGLLYLHFAMSQRGVAGVNAIKLVFELAEVLQ
jgi:hypothetical protein